MIEQEVDMTELLVNPARMPFGWTGIPGTELQVCVRLDMAAGTFMLRGKPQPKAPVLNLDVIDSVLFHVTDLNAAIAFFELFDMHVHDRRPDGVSMRSPRSTSCVDLSTELPSSPHGDPHWRVDDVIEFGRELAAKEVRLGPTFRTDYGTGVVVRGPDEIRILVLDESRLT